MSAPAQIAASRANGARSKGPVTAPGKLNSSRNDPRHGLLAPTIVLEDESRDRFRQLLDALVPARKGAGPVHRAAALLDRTLVWPFCGLQKEEYNPSTTTQCLLIETMAVARWRLLRIWTLQRISRRAAKAQRRSEGREPGGLRLELAVLRPKKWTGKWLLYPFLGPPEVLATMAFRESAETPGAELLLRYETAYDRQFNRALTRLLALQSNPPPQPPQPYAPASSPGHTFEQAEPDAEAEIPPSAGPEPRASLSKDHPTERTQEPVDSFHPRPFTAGSNQAPRSAATTAL